MAIQGALGDAGGDNLAKEAIVRGTLLCGMTDADDGRDVLELGVELSERLGLRLVLAHVTEGIPSVDVVDGEPSDDKNESVTMKANREGSIRRLAQLAHEYGVAGSAERRVAVGDPPTLLAQIAAEEAADAILVGARSRGWRRRSFESRLAEALEAETPLPLLIAPPRTRSRHLEAVANGRGR